MIETSENIPGREPRGMLSGSRRKVLRRSVAVAVSVATISFFTPSTAAAAPPVFGEGASTTREVAENTATNMNVGSAVAATDDDGDTIAYTLGGTDALSFVIEGDGQIKTSVALDFETKMSYSVMVEASDGTNTASIGVTINVTDENEFPPVFGEGASTTRDVAENTATNMNVGSAVAATDGDDSAMIAYTLGGTDALSFVIEGDGQIKTSVALDFETKMSYSVMVEASDGTNTASIDVTINVTDENEFPPVFGEGESTTRYVAENTATNMNVGSPVAATDADGSAMIAYTLDGAEAASFGIDSASGQILTSAPLTKSSYLVKVEASDGTNTDSIRVTIDVTANRTATAKPPRTAPPPLLAPEQVPEFVDVDGGGETQSAIELIAARGITRGDREGRFRPKEAVSRAYAAVFIARVLGYQQNAELAAALAGDGPSTDVDASAWYAPSIDQLMRLRIMRSYSDGTFRPHQLVTRAEMATLLVRAFTGIDRVAPASGQASFVDVDPRSEHAAAIEGLRADGVTVGCSSDPPRYCPDKPVTRAQLALFLARALRLADN